ncbi:MAG: hypothetical protein JST92_12305 [Deltaproteobacteria bacterium]|nr:hypothetical protein [Deltaproteobacteria bacterium]
MGKTKLLVGGTYTDDTAAKAPFDVRYLYLAGGMQDGTGPCNDCRDATCTSHGALCDNAHGCGWWGCWQYDHDAPGTWITSFANTSNTAHHIPMITYYEILQASGVNEGTDEVTNAANNTAFMTRFFNDVRFLVQKLGSGNALVQYEPDFWGYAMHVNQDPDQIPAKVAAANATDCGSLPNTISGMGQCLVKMTHQYAPRAKVALHASAWATGVDVTGNNSASLDVAAEATKLGNFMKKIGGNDLDFITVDASDRDAGFYQQQGRNTWWDETNATLPNFHQAFAWTKGVAETAGKPIVFWQVPLGNAAQNNTKNHYKDNRVDYFFAHTSELTAAHVAGMLFGAGEGQQTTAETDGNNFISKSQAYFNGAGAPMCPQ